MKCNAQSQNLITWILQTNNGTVIGTNNKNTSGSGRSATSWTMSSNWTLSNLKVYLQKYGKNCKKLKMMVTRVTKRNEKSKEQRTKKQELTLWQQHRLFVEHGQEWGWPAKISTRDWKRRWERGKVWRDGEGQTREKTEVKSIRGRAIRLRSSVSSSSDNLYDFIITHSSKISDHQPQRKPNPSFLLFT